MKNLLFILFVFLFQKSSGQAFSYPTIPSTGINLKNFIPQGWNILDSSYGDLNNDDKKDLAIVIEKIDSVTATISFQKEKYTATFKPRILFVLFANGKNKGYIKKLQNNSIIPINESECIEPFAGINIEKRTIELHLESMGTSNCAYKYRFKLINNNFKLVYEKYLNVHKPTGDIEEWDYYFSSGKTSFSTGHISRDKPDKITWKKEKPKPLQSLKNIKEIW